MEAATAVDGNKPWLPAIGASSATSSARTRLRSRGRSASNSQSSSAASEPRSCRLAASGTRRRCDSAKSRVSMTSLLAASGSSRRTRARERSARICSARGLASALRTASSRARKRMAASSSGISTSPTGCCMRASSGPWSNFQSSPSSSLISSSASRDITYIFRLRDRKMCRGRFCTENAVIPRATDSFRSMHQCGRPVSRTVSSVKTTWPSVTALASSTKASGTPEKMLSSGNSASCFSTLAIARFLVSSSNAISLRFSSFASNSSLPTSESSLTRANASSVIEPPPRSSDMRPAR
mmetsp:Transcript_71001/g.179119  ORF Transcript_71001/g.179119 Transcript_71001/m.179119 type:complete len:297 (+) Transcript_71001:357-1247(+)